MSLNQAFAWNMGTCRSDDEAEQARKNACSQLIREKPQVVKSHEGESTDAEHRDGATRSSDEVHESGWSKGVALPALKSGQLK